MLPIELQYLEDKGFKIEKFTEFHFRIEDRLDVWPKSRKYHNKPTGDRGTYTKLQDLVYKFVGVIQNNDHVTSIPGTISPETGLIHFSQPDLFRDHCATEAMKSLLGMIGETASFDEIADKSYQMADAMVKARKERGL